MAYVLLRRAPLLLLILAAIVFAIARWKRHPRVSLMTVIALIIYTVESLTYSVLFYWSPRVLYSFKMTDHGTRIVETVLALCDDFAYGCALILLVAAAFTGRARNPSMPV